MTNLVPTEHVNKLASALESRGVVVELEHWDKHKHIDIYIPSAAIYIEVDGIHHFTNSGQIITDFKRNHYSDGDDFDTMHIPNIVVDQHLEEVADAIAEVVKMRSTT